MRRLPTRAEQCASAAKLLPNLKSSSTMPRHKADAVKGRHTFWLGSADINAAAAACELVPQTDKHGR